MNRTIMLLALAVGVSALGTTVRSADEPRGRSDDKAVRRDAPGGDDVVRPERPQAGPRDGERDSDMPPCFARNRKGGPATVCPYCKRELGAGVQGPRSDRGIRPRGQARGDRAGNRQWGPPTDGRRPEMGPMARRDGDRQFGRGGDRPSGPMRPGFRPPMGGPAQGQRGFGPRPQDRQAGPGSQMRRRGMNRGPQMRGSGPFEPDRRMGPPMQGGRPPMMGPMGPPQGDRGPDRRGPPGRPDFN